MNTICSPPSLPIEILDKIAFYVDSHEDLISLALTCWQLKEVVIPDHSDYRMITIQHDMHHLWADFVKSPRVAQHVKALHLYDPDDWTPRPRYLKTLDDHSQGDDEPLRSSKEKEEIKLSNMCQALRNMTALQEFVWHFYWGDNNQLARSDPNAIFRVLAECKSLTHLVLLGRSFTQSVDMVHDVGDFPVSMYLFFL
jgi:hypothetical protein